MIKAHIAETNIATMQVSNIPLTPLPILPMSSTPVDFPVRSMIRLPEKIPDKSTKNTLQPAIPPNNTKMYGIIRIK